MVDASRSRERLSSDVSPLVVWIIFFSAALLYISLWLVSSPGWHILISLSTLACVFLISDRPARLIAQLALLILFLTLLQISFSEFMRDMFLRSLAEGFRWQDWQYLLFAMERFTLPLAIVGSFQSKLAQPATIIRLSKLLNPLQKLGMNVEKLQILLVLALRFLPNLRREWGRFESLQTYFVSKLPRKSLLQRLQYWQSVLKAMIAHTIHQSVSTGDVLALKGYPDLRTDPGAKGVFLPFLLWSILGAISYVLDHQILWFWGFATLWMMVAQRTLNGDSVS